MFCFVLIAQFNSFHRTSFLAGIHEISGGTYQKLTNFTDYIKLKDINERLAQENAFLRSQQIKSFVSPVSNFVEIQDTNNVLQYKYLEAKVVNNTLTRRNNYLILNKGLRDGIQPGMGVVNLKNGVVGVVKSVSQNYCSVNSVLHKTLEVSSKLKKSDAYGILSWKNDDSHTQISLEDIPLHVELQKGDTVVTRGSSGIFPEGFPIGVINHFEIKDGESFYKIKLDLITDFKQLSYVYVVNNQLKNEQEQLEAEIKETND
jgi:rod shape-determining protein MreC